MRHEGEGRLMAYLDGAMAPSEAAEVGTHLEGCGACRGVAEGLRAERKQLSAALALLEVDAGAAAARIRARLGAPVRAAAPARSLPASAPPVRPARSAPRGFRLGRGQLLRAAMLVLFVAGGASALVPNSPLRRWIEGAGGGAAPPEPRTLPVPEAATAPAEVSLSAAAVGAPLTVRLELPPGSEFEVNLQGGDRATVHAPPEALFRSGPELLSAEVPAGRVRVELPVGASDLSLLVGGQVYVRIVAGRLRLEVPAADSSDGRILFRSP